MKYFFIFIPFFIGFFFKIIYVKIELMAFPLRTKH